LRREEGRGVKGGGEGEGGDDNEYYCSTES